MTSSVALNPVMDLSSAYTKGMGLYVVIRTFPSPEWTRTTLYKLNMFLFAAYSKDPFLVDSDDRRRVLRRVDTFECMLEFFVRFCNEKKGLSTDNTNRITCVLRKLRGNTIRLVQGASVSLVDCFHGKEEHAFSMNCRKAWIQFESTLNAHRAYSADKIDGHRWLFRHPIKRLHEFNRHFSTNGFSCFACYVCGDGFEDNAQVYVCSHCSAVRHLNCMCASCSICSWFDDVSFLILCSALGPDLVPHIIRFISVNDVCAKKGGGDVVRCSPTSYIITKRHRGSPARLASHSSDQDLEL
jgi:hypothetical protein